MATRMVLFRAPTRAGRVVVNPDLLMEGWREACRSGCGPHSALPPAVARRAWRPFLCRRLSGSFDNLAGTDAGCADTQGLPGPIHEGMDTLEVGVPPSPGDVVSMAHVISVRRAFAANFTMTSHQKLL
jgi:hypothetical protein